MSVVHGVTPESNFVQNTVIAASFGATASGAFNYARQKIILKNPQLYLENIKADRDSFVKIAKQCLKDGSDRNMIKNCINYINVKTKEQIVYVKELAKSGKINWKDMGKSAGKGALAFAVVYSIYRGIKSLFSLIF